MPETASIARPALGKPFDFNARLTEISMFFEGNDAVHQTMHRVAERLEKAGIAYAIAGGMAVNAHQHRRTTGDVDFLVSAEGFAAFVEIVAAGEFEKVVGRPRRFLDPATGVTFDFLIAGRFPGSGNPGPIAFPLPSAVHERMGDRQVVNLRTLIELKLAAGRHKDFGDVVELIRVHDLNESYLPNLHPSVHGDFIECLEEKRREDDYERRENQAVEEQMRKDGDGKMRRPISPTSTIRFLGGESTDS
jgi:hypothetical protein